MKNKSKKRLQTRGIISAGRALNAPSAQPHDDKRREKRSEFKRQLKREIEFQTARTRGPFPFSGWILGQTAHYGLGEI